MRAIWQSEIEPFACKVLAHHWPGVPNLGDIQHVDWSNVERPDLICGGFPCQDISSAGLKVGITGKRSGLWKSMASAIRMVRPRYVLVENVGDLVVRGLDVVLGDLHLLGFDAEWSAVSACSMGAPHPRQRLFVVAHRPGGDEQDQVSHDPFSPREQADWQGQSRGSGSAGGGRLRWLPEPEVGRVADGIPYRMVRASLGRLGNAAVPQVAEWIGRRIVEAEAEVAA